MPINVNANQYKRGTKLNFIFALCALVAIILRIFFPIGGLLLFLASLSLAITGGYKTWKSGAHIPQDNKNQALAKKWKRGIIGAQVGYTLETTAATLAVMYYIGTLSFTASFVNPYFLAFIIAAGLLHYWSETHLVANSGRIGPSIGYRLYYNYNAGWSQRSNLIPGSSIQERFAKKSK